MFALVLLATALTNVAELAAHTLSGAGDADFRLTAQVTHEFGCEFSQRFVTVRDPTGNAFLITRDGPGVPRFQAGDEIRIEGECVRNALPYLTALSVLRHGEPPQPPTVSVADLAADKFDWQPVHVIGVVRDVLPSETSANWVFLVIVADGAFLYVSAPLNGTPLADFERLLGRQVRATGFNNPRDGSLRSYRGRIFNCAGIAAVRPLSDAPPDPFAAPSVDTLRHLRPATIAALARVKASGRVLSVWGARRVLVRTADDEAVQLVCDRSPLPRRGDFIEASGFPLSDFFHISLAHAVWRPATPVPVPERPALALSAQDVLVERFEQPTPKDHLQGRTVTLSAHVRNLPDTGVRTGVMLVEDGSFIVPVDVSAAPDALRDVRVGCDVRVTGTCLLETETWSPNRILPQIKGLRIVVNDRAGVVVTHRPSWWTPGRLMVVIGALLAGLLGILIWNAALRRLATRKGRELMREQLRHVRAELKTEERTRLAVELHDTLAQNLTGVSMEIEAASELRGNAPPEMLTHVTIAAKALKSCRDELRNCLWDLRSQALEETDMNRAILRTLQPHINDSHVAVRFNIPRARISDNTAHALLRIVRELVVNAIRHGNATAVKIAGTLDRDALRCSVADNGAGFDPETAPGIQQGHFGLQGIRERVAELGGAFALESAPGQGARAAVTIPVPQEA